MGENSSIRLDTGSTISVTYNPDAKSENLINIGTNNDLTITQWQGYGNGFIVIGNDNLLEQSPKNTVLIGNNSKVSESADSVIIGNDNTVYGIALNEVDNPQISANVAVGSGIVMGSGTSTGVTEYLQKSTAIGGDIYMEEGDNNTAVGYGSKIYSGKGNVALGTEVVIGEDGKESLDNIAIGSGANITTADMTGQSIAIGKNSSVSKSSYAVAFGPSAKINGANYGMALGLDSAVEGVKYAVAMGYNDVTPKS